MKTVEEIKEIIDEFFSDTSVSQEVTLEGLEEIASDIEFKIEALRSDIKRDKNKKR